MLIWKTEVPTAPGFYFTRKTWGKNVHPTIEVKDYRRYLPHAHFEQGVEFAGPLDEPIDICMDISRIREANGRVIRRLNMNRLYACDPLECP